MVANTAGETRETAEMAVVADAAGETAVVADTAGETRETAVVADAAGEMAVFADPHMVYYQVYQLSKFLLLLRYLAHSDPWPSQNPLFFSYV